MSHHGLEISAVAFISPQNNPMLVKTIQDNQGDELKYHYIAHTSLDVLDERTATDPKSMECYLGLLYVMEDTAVYGYITPTRVKIILALAQTDAFVKDVDVILIFKALHGAYHDVLSNPFHSLDAFHDSSTEQLAQFMTKGDKWHSLKIKIDHVAAAARELKTGSKDV